jgi:hypothetical protein
MWKNYFGKNIRNRTVLKNESEFVNYKLIAPCEELKEIICYYWVSTWDARTQKPNDLYYIIANSLTEITFAFSGSEKHDELLFSIVQGHTETPMQTPVHGFYHLVGVSLYSYAIPSLFNLPSFELNQEFISLTTFLGEDGNILNERIALAATTDQRIEILSDYFKSQLKDHRLTDPRMINAIQEIKNTMAILK